jgi:DNA-binding XRE family transcriptional regulator
MALDRTCKDVPYMTGRLIAITAHYAEKHFGPNTLGEMMKFPRRYIEAFWHYVDRNDPEIAEIDIAPPVSMPTAAEQSQAWVGYYHQRAAYDTDKTSERQRIGRRIAELRKEQNMTQAQLAERCGVAQAHIARIETGRYSVGLDTLAQIATALGRSIDFVQP